MAYIQWRRFNFFNRQNILNSQGESWWAIKQKQLTCSSCGRGYLYFGDDQGFIHVVNHNFQVTSFKAFQLTVQHLIQLMQHHILAAVGIDEQGINPVVKIWNMDKRDKYGVPFCCRVQSAVPSNNIPTPVTAFAVNENLTFMAVGFSQGSITVFKGDVIKDRSSNKSVHLVTDTNQPVTGLNFYNSAKVTTLFATTSNSVLSYNLQDKSPKKKLLDSRDCAPLCSGSSGADQPFFVASSEAVYLYDPDSRGPCFVFEGEKLMAKWFNGYLVLAYKDKTKNSLPSTSSVRVHEKNLVNVYDVKQKLLVYSSTFPGVRELLYEWGSFFILEADNNLICLQEIDIHDKLEMLFKKNYYSLAINMARSQNLSEEGLVDIYTQYADHLYSKADYDGAIAQYVKTIGYLEPSRIIRRFLDAQRIHNLTSYLQALHQMGLANEDHTTLLLNCFTKLKDVENLNKFIMTPGTELHFDVETAMKVCRQAGYSDHALRLAEKHKKHKWYLKIQLEDAQQYKKALSYIRKLQFSEAEQNVVQYGKVLLDNAPEETTQLIKDLCTDYQPDTDLSEQGLTVSPNTSRSSSGENFIHIFVSAPDMLVEFLQHLITVKDKASENIFTTLLEIYLDKIAQSKQPQPSLEEKTLSLLKDYMKNGYDVDRALVLCQTLNFRPGILYLYETAGLYQNILRYHMDNEAYSFVIDTCRRHGDKDTSLWQQALTYFAQKKESDCKQHIEQVLNHIDKHNLLPPLLVVQILSKNSTLTLAVVRDYLLRRIRQDTEAIEECERSIESYKEETEKVKKHIDELQNSAVIFQETKCSLCNQGLELPAVHFLCQHAYHQHCLESYSDNEDECPVCAGRNKKILENLRQQEQTLTNSIEQREEFMSRLSRSADGFSVVADYFSKGFFDQLTILPDAQKNARASSREPSLQKDLLMMQPTNMP